MSRKLATLALLLSAALTACGGAAHRETVSAVPDAHPTGPAAQRAAEVARAWPGSADERVWRTGYFPLSTALEWLPKDAFKSGDDKFAFWSGQLDLKVPLPAAGPSAEVVWQSGARMTLPLLPAGQVFRGLTEGKSPCLNHCGTRLSVTAVKAGTRTVQTSRGQATVPVWEFSIAGYAEPFAYPAVAPQQPTRPMPPTTAYPVIPGATSASWTGTSADGLKLTGRVPHGSCGELLPGEVYETDAVVVLIGHTKSKLKPGMACTLALRASPMTFRLARPLGNRTVLDLVSGAPQVQQPASPGDAADGEKDGQY